MVLCDPEEEYAQMMSEYLKNVKIYPGNYILILMWKNCSRESRRE